jgi:glycosyltransferase involved in cell wall biosynthesis
MYKDLRITVVIPCLNEEPAIGRVLDGLPTFVDEVIVVDNNSTDRTAEVARARGAMVVTELNRGYGRAYKRGFSVACGDIVVTLDGDHSYPVDALSYLIEAFLHSRVGFLSGSRFPTVDPEAMSLKHRIGNRILSLVMSILFLRWVSDSQSGMWVFRRELLSQMNLVSDGLAFSEEIKIEAIRNPEIGFREMSINYSQRLGEKKLEPWKDGIRNITFLFQKRFSRANGKNQRYFEGSQERLRD